jgi:hypothetical protein
MTAARSLLLILSAALLVACANSGASAIAAPTVAPLLLPRRASKFDCSTP